jgi:hypothetical protein
MFNNKRIEELEQRISKLEGYNIPDRLIQLECDHLNISFEARRECCVSDFYERIPCYHDQYSKVCKKCGKILKNYLSESDYLIDKRAYLKEKHKEEENCITLKLKGLKKEQQENKNDN